MSDRSQEFQVFAKPVGAKCNLSCTYCYYLEKDSIYESPVGQSGPEQPENKPANRAYIMPDDILDKFIIQNIEATHGPVINFSWHGGEPALAGLDFYKKAVGLQKKHNNANKRIINGIQTNGTHFSAEWYEFLARENFIVGLSIDGPERYHNLYRKTASGKPTFKRVMASYRNLRKQNILTEILCVVHSGNMNSAIEVYRFFKEIGVRFITFLPLVIKDELSPRSINEKSVTPEGFGSFMISVFNEWVSKDIGKIKVQLFEEAARTAFKQQHTLCIFREECGGVPVVERNGDFYSCDHFVDSNHLIGNIKKTSLTELLDGERQRSFGKAKRDTLPGYCLKCEVLSMCNGECPKNRFISTPDGEEGLNYLCSGYRKFFNHCKPWVDSVALAWKLKTVQGLSAGKRIP
jgi:uncharacterized protein